MTKQYQVHVCQFPGGGSTRPEVGDFLAKTLVKLKADNRVRVVKWFSKSDTPITMVRNLAVKEAIEMGSDYILMIDNDMGPDYLVGEDPMARPFWDVAWEFMMNRREAEIGLAEELQNHESLPGAKAFESALIVYPPATIAGPYCGPPPLEIPYIFRWKDNQTDNPDPDFYLECLERSDAAMRTGIEEVAALPTGLILYDTRVFKALEKASVLPWFDYEYADPPYNTRKATTEDVWQTRNGTLLEPSLPLYVAWDCWAIHFKIKAVKKPRAVTAAVVKGVMREALKSQYEDHNDRQAVVNPHDPKFVLKPPQAELVGEAERKEARVHTIDPCASIGFPGPSVAVSEEPVPGVGRHDHSRDGQAGGRRERAPVSRDEPDHEELRAIVCENR